MRNPQITLTALAALALALAQPACLPDTLSDEALHAKVLDATAGKGGPTCGDQVVDEAESCDDGNTDGCDACDKCQKRTTLAANGPKALAGRVGELGPLLFDGKTSWSWELWFSADALPGKGKTAFFLVEAALDSNTALQFAMGLSADGVPLCALSRADVKVAAYPNVTVALQSWHHLRCVWDASANKLGASLDGAAVQIAAGGAGGGGKALFLNGFDAKSVLAIGQLPTQLGTEAFAGQVDEVRAATGEATSAPIQRRYAPGPGVVALYHMDPKDAAVRVIHDATANQLDLDQITFQGSLPTKRDADLTLLPESCYGYSAANAECQANPKPPWCL